MFYFILSLLPFRGEGNNYKKNFVLLLFILTILSFFENIMENNHVTGFFRRSLQVAPASGRKAGTWERDAQGREEIACSRLSACNQQSPCLEKLAVIVLFNFV